MRRRDFLRGAAAVGVTAAAGLPVARVWSERASLDALYASMWEVDLNAAARGGLVVWASKNDLLKIYPFTADEPFEAKLPAGAVVECVEVTFGDCDPALEIGADNGRG